MRLLLLSFLLLTGSALWAQQAAYFLSDPSLSPNAKVVYFAYEGDIWQVERTGGVAKRLTGMQGYESRPVPSPDGRWLAFSADQYGNKDIFILPLEGGAIQRLTFSEANDDMESWSWDSKTLYFTSNRQNRYSAYTVSLQGDTPKPLFQHYYNTVSGTVAHPNNERLYFNDSWEAYSAAFRKRYKGAFNPDIKSYHPEKGDLQQHTEYEGKDFWLSFDRSGQLYFCSDRANGEYNLHRYNGEKIEELTKFNRSIYRPKVSANGEAVVFEKDYQLHVWDVRARKATPLDVQIFRNDQLPQSLSSSTKGKISAFDISADGKKLAFVSRGALFVSDVKGKFVRQMPTAVGERVGEVHWQKDSRQLLYSQTHEGYYNWFRIAADGQSSEEQLTKEAAHHRGLTFNSEKTTAAFLRGREQLCLLDLKKDKVTELLTAEFWGLRDNTLQFSPDDRYLAFTAHINFERDIFIYDFKEKKQHNLTKTGLPEVEPYWSPDGKYLYFTASRTGPSYPYGMRDAKVYRIPLTKRLAPSRYTAFDELFEEKEKEEEDEKEDEKEEDEDKKEKPKKEKVVVKIDWDELLQRWEQVGPKFGRQTNPSVFQQKKKQHVLYRSNHDEGKYQLYLSTYEDFEKTKIEVIKGSKGASGTIRKGKKGYFVLKKGGIHKLDLAKKSLEAIEISHTFECNRAEEFRQMFEETWANMETNFYAEDMGGIDWKDLKKYYQEFIPQLNTRADLRRLLNDMLGELNASHLGFRSGGREEAKDFQQRSFAVGLLFESESPYTVATVLPNSPADYLEGEQRPQVGDEILAVNGVAIDKQENRERYFSGAKRPAEVRLRFKRGNKTIETRLPSISLGQQKQLRYKSWVREKQAMVDEASDKRIAYIHMPNMGGGALDDFIREMTSETHQRDALILDLRFNTGGNVHDRVLQFLSQKRYLSWRYREGETSSQPHFTPADKPIVLLINYQTLSDGEMTAAGFKELGLGKIMGTSTYRWIIFTSSQRLVDGSYHRMPSWGCYTLEGDDLERTGVDPDIEIKNSLENREQNRDPQLERALKEIEQQLRQR